ncbi:hypothetical protein [Martelella sp. AD-3]|uniref:phage head spike fiber domain-containing protein n=1 Tax=Martelella sp. AD-3 TaxID=686597 RepID=UPI000466651C|nr:hypothetical protein [Martelella sp. AD-3]AMM84805.1 hypothetical protein AZF01_10920 [Martelella sp. AD-3]
MQPKAFAEMINFTRPGTATYIGADGLIHTAAADVPRFDYTNGRRQLLLEGPATNLFSRSADLGSLGSQRCTSTQGYIAPDGTPDAIRSVCSGEKDPIVQRIAFGNPSGQTQTFSVWLRTADAMELGGKCRLYGYGSTGLEALMSTTIDGLTSEWQRIRFTVTWPEGMESTSVNWRVDPFDGIDGTDTPPAGAAIDSWGWQVEVGDHATSYIPTDGSAVTRPADKAFLTPALNGLLSREQWTLVLDAAWMSWSDNTTAFVLFLQGANGKTIRAGAASGNGKVFFGGDTSLFTNTDALPGETYKIAIRRDGPTIAMSVNGESVISGPTGATEIADTRLGWSTSLIANPTNMATDQSIVWPFAVTDAELRRLSS